MANGLVKSPFTIDKNTDGVTFLSADLVDVSVFTTIMSYDVPLGTAIEILPTNYHFGDLKTTGGTTISAGSSRILKQNANGTESRELWQGSNAIFKDIGDKLQRPSINIPVVVNSSQKIVVQVINLGTTLDSVSSNYYIECQQVYEEI
jgi:hypothetical protein